MTRRQNASHSKLSSDRLLGRPYCFTVFGTVQHHPTRQACYQMFVALLASSSQKKMMETRLLFGKSFKLSFLDVFGGPCRFPVFHACTESSSPPPNLRNCKTPFSKQDQICVSIIMIQQPVFLSPPFAPVLLRSNPSKWQFCMQLASDPVFPVDRRCPNYQELEISSCENKHFVSTLVESA